MTKPCWIFVLVLALISIYSERANAELFSSKIEGEIESRAFPPDNSIQVAQAIQEPGDSTAYSTSIPDFGSRFAKNQYEFG
jgi:hypothetical protein